MGGDKIFSAQTAQLVLAAVTTGLLGNADLLGTPAAQSTLKSLSGILKRLDQDSETKSVEKMLAEATSDMSVDEKERLEMIVTEITRRILQKVRMRVAKSSTVSS